eukprot:15325339-Ditylum_brightwellii.AAC.1
MKTLTSINGSTAYIMVTDHHLDAMWTVCTSNKCPLLAWLNELLNKFKQKGEHYAMMDLGGELGKHPEVQLLLQQHGCNARPTAPDTSYQNAPGERPHQTIANVIRTMLESANLPEKYWSCVLYHYTNIHRYVTHRGRDKTPYKIITCKGPDLSKL